MNGYKTSKDYKRLKELVDNGYRVVCFTTYDWDEGYDAKIIKYIYELINE